MSYSRKLLILTLIISLSRLIFKLFVMWKLTMMPYRGYLVTMTNLGITLHFAIGPLFYFYTKSRIDQGYRLSNKDYLHFLPSLILFILVFVYHNSFWSLGVLRLHYLHIVAYYLLSIRLYLLTIAKEPDFSNRLWSLKITLIVLAILMLIYSPILYFYIDLTDALLFYGAGFYLVYLMIRYNGQLRPIVKYKNSTLSQEKAEKLKSDLDQMMSAEKIYLDSKLTLQRLAEKLSVNMRYLSQCINEYYQQSFTDYINSLRIEEVKLQIQDDRNSQYKIAYLAYNCGFESISSFNTAFKKFTGMTPSQFKNSASD
ncbi:MAG: helix-turn-helix transcriptional regulator [Calditrichaeota bacterium]|nr:helix-turn-helix transcriptional regulator [Calditrichota bacterium]